MADGCGLDLAEFKRELGFDDGKLSNEAATNPFLSRLGVADNRLVELCLGTVEDKLASDLESVDEPDLTGYGLLLLLVVRQLGDKAAYKRKSQYNLF